jgi:carbon monoxide dehydrogenase subunit G
MAHTPDGVDPLDPRALVTTRLIAAARERVFGALADPAQLARWWGPDGFTNTVHAFDFRPGGEWRLTMHGPDGTDYAGQVVRFASIAPQRVVMVHETPPWFELAVTLDEDPAGTRVGWRQTFATAAQCAQLAPMCIPANAQNLERLQAVIAAMP